MTRSSRRPKSSCLRLATLTLAWHVLTGIATAQCTPQWQPSVGFPGLAGPVSAATLWDADGSGPLSPQLIVAGWFAFASATPASNLAAYDLATGTWSTMGGATVGLVMRFLTMPSGDLAAIGPFTQIGGVSAPGVALWNGVGWSPLGSQIPLPFDGVLMPNGDLIVGGGLSIIGGYLARWNGTAWTSLASFPIGLGGTGVVQHLAVAANGDLLVAGDFVLAGAVAVNYIARWNGATFAPLGSGLSAAARGLTVLANGDIVVGVASQPGIAPVRRWNSATWSDLGSGLGAGTVRAFASAANGDLLAAGNLPTVARWNGIAWSRLGVTTGAEVTALVPLPTGEVVAAGGFDFIGSVPAGNIARWDATSWSALSSGGASQPPFTRVQAMVTLPNGDVVAGGRYSRGESVSLPTYAVVRNRVARWDGTTWSLLGEGIAFAADATVYSLAVLPNGDVVAGGKFATIGGVPVANVARWNGSTWSPLGAGMNDSVDALAVLPNGDLVAGGRFTQAGTANAPHVARWNGTAWLAMGSGFNDLVNALAVWNGSLVAAGWFTTSGSTVVNRVARWSGSAWMPLGAGIGDSYATSLVPLPTGDLLVGGWFSVAGGVPCNHVTRWDGAVWSAVGGGTQGGVNALMRLPDGNVVAAGWILLGSGGVFAAVARFDGLSWLPFGNLELAPPQVGTGYAVAFRDEGELLVGGEFLTVDGNLSPYVARRVASCPAIAVPVGAGCAGGGGTNVLVATSRPWIGGTLRATASGLSASSFGVAVYGTSGVSLSLATWFAQAQPNCLLLASPTVLQLHVAAAGQLASALAIPPSLALVGAGFHHQVIAAEIDALGNVAAITASNALQLMVGAF